MTSELKQHDPDKNLKFTPFQWLALGIIKSAKDDLRTPDAGKPYDTAKKFFCSQWYEFLESGVTIDIGDGFSVDDIIESVRDELDARTEESEFAFRSSDA
ncbi:MAG: hypothetical protein PVJ39_04610 [Gammaproteobacteria bacterium]|jgi:hypothetical protein